MAENNDFRLDEAVTFGYSRVCGSGMTISKDGLSARKIDPLQNYAYGVVYGEKRLSGATEFEVEIVQYDNSWSWAGNIKIGLVRVEEKKELSFSDTPRYSPSAQGHYVWCSDKIYDNFQPINHESMYGMINLDDLRAGKRVGLRIDNNGNLSFLVDGRSQGIAHENVFSKGYKLYVLVDHYARCVETRITRASEFLI